MRIDLEFVELHAPLFIAGINFGLKLYADPRKNKAPIVIYYDTEGTGKWTKEEHVVVEYQEKVTIIPTFASMTVKSAPKLVKVPEPLKPQPAIKAQIGGPEKFSAQISTPMDQVQGKPGRKAKYQGEESPE